MASRVLGGRYTVQDKIGSGGMATVFRGLDEVLGRTVAIKTMLPQYANDESFAARFKQEAQAAAALQSPYIVSVYDWGKDNDTYYIVMEYLRGTDLKSGIRKHGALDCKKVAQIGSQIAQALSVAHKHDIIHRDIKPQNIMVQPDGNVKVMDFGIARAKNSHLTTDNSVLGTAHYVSPEQTQGKALGPTTDIYSLGVVMYEAATGQVPFQGDDAISVAVKQVNEQPKPPSELNPEVDPSLESIILKCMQKNPDDRFQSANELYRTLRDYLAGRTQAVNAATANLPVQTTTVMSPAPVTTTKLPRVSPESTGTLVAPHYRQTTATEQAAEEEKRRRRRSRRNAFFGFIAGLAVVALIAYLLMQYFGSGTGTYPIPNLLGLTEEEALQEIRDDGHFTIGSVKRNYSDSVEEGRVMDQDPGANREFSEGTEINIVVSRGPEPAVSVTVPDLLNMTPSQVDQELARLGLIGHAGDPVFSDLEIGHVAEQEPSAGSTAKAGDTVTYYLSKGSEEVVVPNVTGDTEQAARSAIANANLEVAVTTSTSESVPEGFIIRQSPEAGATLEKGGTVTIVVSTGTGYVTVPSVVGQTLENARQTLANAGFSVYANEVASDQAAGTVIAQNYTSATPGTTITLTVSTGPEQEETPAPEPSGGEDTSSDAGSGEESTSDTGV